MALIKFERISSPVGSVIFATNPSTRGYSGSENYYQPISHSIGGDLYCYDKSINPEQKINFKWNALSYTSFEGLMDFYKIVKKSRYNFTFTDYDLTTLTAKFASTINWSFIKSNLVELSFDIVILQAIGTVKISPSQSPSKSPSVSPSASLSPSPSPSASPSTP